MNSLSSRLRSKTSMAIALYILALASVVVLANAQMNALRLFPMGHSVGLKS